MKKVKVMPYDEDKRTGIIRHVLIKTSSSTKESLVVLVIGTENFPGRNNFIKALTSKCPNISTIIQNINNSINFETNWISCSVGINVQNLDII